MKINDFEAASEYTIAINESQRQLMVDALVAYGRVLPKKHILQEWIEETADMLGADLERDGINDFTL